MRPGVGALLPLLVVVAAGCSEDPEPASPPAAETSTAPTEYDPALEPSAAALSLVPADATSLEVTDFDQLRLSLGFGTLDGRSPAEERARFWRMAQDEPTFSPGLLRPFEDRLSPFGVGQDDVAWEARYSGDATGWVVAFHERVSAASLRRAVKARVGPFAGAYVDAERRLLLSAEPPTPEDSWAADGTIGPLVGHQANATYVERGCLEFDTVFGEGMESELASAPRAALDALDPLEGFSIALGAELATVRLGEARSDAFDRLRLSEVMPQIRPDFGVGFARGVADPSTGRLGYDLQRPDVVIQLIEQRHLPFAVCSG